MYDNIVNLYDWKPGEDVDVDALVKAELIQYREADSMKNVPEKKFVNYCEHLHIREFYANTKCLDCGQVIGNKE